MHTYYLKRYRRAGLGQTTGMLTDELTFTADSAAEAEASDRRKFFSGIAAMDWEKDLPCRGGLSTLPATPRSRRY